jgi:hypothetical protein
VRKDYIAWSADAFSNTRSRNIIDLSCPHEVDHAAAHISGTNKCDPCILKLIGKRSIIAVIPVFDPQHSVGDKILDSPPTHDSRLSCRRTIFSM